jgi:hypothetical protein
VPLFACDEELGLVDHHSIIACERIVREFDGTNTASPSDKLATILSNTTLPTSMVTAPSIFLPEIH